MTTNKALRFPIGIALFDTLIDDNYVYVDKTRFVHELTSIGKYYFLSRPRRFGKSLLLTTLAAYFEGKRHLFDGLDIAALQPNPWPAHPVIKLSLNGMTYDGPSSLSENLISCLRRIAKSLGIEFPEYDRPETCFAVLIEEAHAKYGKEAVILIDEYDAPLTDTIGRDDLQEKFRDQLKAFYTVLKVRESDIRFCMLTGVTRFGKVSVFSGLNNLNDITFDDRFAGICGITDDELRRFYQNGVERFAESEGISVEEAFETLKFYYDGYHFSTSLLDIYNPYSINHALDRLAIDDYWCSSGAPTVFVKQLMAMDYDLEKLCEQRVEKDEISNLSAFTNNPVPLFYQTGYLTIKSYDKRRKTFTLGYPNREVEEGLMKNVISVYLPQGGKPALAVDMADALADGKPEKFIAILNSFLAGIPRDLRAIIANYENYYHTLFYTITKLIGLHVEAEYATSEGYIDILIKTDRLIYVIELKVNGTAADAAAQIKQKHYAHQFAADSRRTICIGIGFSKKSNTVDSYEIFSLPGVAQEEG